MARWWRRLVGVQKPVLHQHEWRLLSHVDGCHWFSTSYYCTCGAMRRDNGERRADSAMFLIAERWDACERCRELHDGAHPRAFWWGVQPAIRR